MASAHAQAFKIVATFTHLTPPACGPFWFADHPGPGDEGSLGRFDIALYKCDDAFCGQQDCGTFVEEICDKPGYGRQFCSQCILTAMVARGTYIRGIDVCAFVGMDYDSNSTRVQVDMWDTFPLSARLYFCPLLPIGYIHVFLCYLLRRIVFLWDGMGL